MRTSNIYKMNRFTPRPAVLSLQNPVAVITGASSGLGRALALKFSKEGYHLALFSRRENELEATRQICIEQGAAAEAILIESGDVTEADALRLLAERVVADYGHINVWVNAAAVFAGGSSESIPIDDMKRVMDVNFFGYVNGARAAMTVFRVQGSGTLININSSIGVASLPYLSSYCASKAAAHAFDDALRMELSLERLEKNIQVCTVMPGVIDTNIYQNGANYTGHTIEALPPVYQPEYVADAVFSLTHHPRRTLRVSPSAKGLVFSRIAFPRLYEYVLSRYTRRTMLSRQHIEMTTGNLYQPSRVHQGTHGGWAQKKLKGETLDKVLVVSAVVIVGGVFTLFAKTARVKK